MSIKDYVKLYDSIGWVVMPIVENEKKPFLKNWTEITSNEYTRDKFKDNSNLGIIMGKYSDIMCIDIDVKKTDGIATLTELEKEYGELPSTVTSETPSGGIHYYFKYHKGIRNRKKIGVGIDIQCDGTQTLEAPSIVNGERYEWIISPFEHEVAQLPPKWLEFLCQEEINDDTIVIPHTFEKPDVVDEGGRNNTMTQYIGSLLGKKYKKQTIIKKAMKYNEESFHPPLDEKEVINVVESMIKTNMRNKSKIVQESIHENTQNNEDFKLPWLTFDETGNASINEILFAIWYIEKNQIHCVNKRLFTLHGLKSDAWFENDIQNIIGGIVVNKVASKVSDLLKVIKTQCFMEVTSPDAYKIQFDNISIDVRDGTIKECDKFFTLHQLPHNYNPKVTCPRWMKFMKELFHDEDLPIVQEYLGYCLIPNTFAQTSLFITGDGGEGKSRITVMMERILGEGNVVIGDFKGLQERFSLSSLDNQMLFIDDDISLDALDDTSNFKKIVTAETSIEVEAKGVPKYKTHLYSKILCCGNGAVASKFDQSDGFYRRLLVVKVRPIEPNRLIDRRLQEKLNEETTGVINWLLEGLLRVIRNGFVIEPSQRMMDEVNIIRENADTISQFLADEQYVNITYNEEDCVSIKDLYTAYERYCDDNAQLCLSKNTFFKRSRPIFKKVALNRLPDDLYSHDVEQLLQKDRMYIDKKRVRGLCGLKLVNYKRSFTIGQ